MEMKSRVEGGGREINHLGRLALHVKFMRVKLEEEAAPCSRNL